MADAVNPFLIAELDSVHDRLEWFDQGACQQPGVDPEMFFPTQGRHAPRRALELCRSCPVQSDCLEFALATDQRFGVWGGLNQTQLQAAARQRRRARPA